ncbi:hypothetical protein TURU_016938 [Turdus rufiventris]|nr:hypothetical protein TURU_016938 [Turdus rufiventris]
MGPGSAGGLGREKPNEAQQGQVLGPAPGEEQPQVPAQAGAQLLQSSSVEKDLGLLVHHKLSMSWQCPCGQEGQGYPGVHWEESGQQWREVIPPLYSALVRPHLECCVHSWAPQDKRDKELLERVQWRATRMTRGLELLSYEKRLWELSLFGLEKTEMGSQKYIEISQRSVSGR